MKKLLAIGIIFYSFSAFGKSDTILEQKVNNLELKIERLDSTFAKQRLNKNHSDIEFEIKDWDKKVKSLTKSEFSWWEDFWSPLLSVLIPIGIAIFAGFQAIRQVDRNGKWALLQSRANTIAEARIEWMQKMRANLSEFSALVASINYHLETAMEHLQKNEDAEATKIYSEQVGDIVKTRALSTEIKLQLNTHEKEHIELDNAIDEYLKYAIEPNEDMRNRDVIVNLSQNIIDKGRIVLKVTWEQAKDEGKNIEI